MLAPLILPADRLSVYNQGKLHLCNFIWLLSWPHPLFMWDCILVDNASIAGTYHTKWICQRALWSIKLCTQAKHVSSD